MTKIRQALIMPSGLAEYFDVPKCASSSVKTALYQAEFGSLFLPDVSDRYFIHQAIGQYRGAMGAAPYRFIIVRDPISRFLSAYRNRVIDHRKLSDQAQLFGDAIKPEGVVLNPGLGQFIEKFDLYSQIPDIEWHTRPLYEQLPCGLDAFSHVYRISELQRLIADLQEIYQKPVVLPVLQKFGTPPSVKQLSSDQLEAVIELCREDYRLLAPLFDIDAVCREWSSDNLPVKLFIENFEDGIRRAQLAPRALARALNDRSIAFVGLPQEMSDKRFSDTLTSAMLGAGLRITMPTTAPSPLVQSANSVASEIGVSQTSVSRFEQIRQLRSMYLRERPDIVYCHGIKASLLAVIAATGLVKKPAVLLELVATPWGSSRIVWRAKEGVRLLVSMLLSHWQSGGGVYWTRMKGSAAMKSRGAISRGWIELNWPLVPTGVGVSASAKEAGPRGVVLFDLSCLKHEDVGSAGSVIDLISHASKTQAHWKKIKLVLPSSLEIRAQFIERLGSGAANNEVLEIVEDVDQLYWEIRRSRAVVVPSLSSAHAQRNAITSMRLGRPTIVPDNELGRSLVDHGESGYVFSCDRLEEILFAVEALCGDAALAKSLGLRARLKAEREFTHATAATRILGQISRLLQV